MVSATTSRPDNPLNKRATDGTVVLHTEHGFAVCMAGDWLPLDALQPTEGMVVTGSEDFLRRGVTRNEVIRPWRYDGTQWVEVPGALVAAWLRDSSSTAVTADKPRAAAQRLSEQYAFLLRQMLDDLAGAAEGSDQRGDFARRVLGDIDARVEELAGDAIKQNRQQLVNAPGALAS